MLSKLGFVINIFKNHTFRRALEETTAFAPANIALVKYWGKRDKELNLPVTDSLSIDLGELGSETSLELFPEDEVVLNGKILDKNDPFSIKVMEFVNLFRDAYDKALDKGSPGLHIETYNNIPTGAGVASSASGFAALTKALNQFFQLDLTDREMSLIANIGSGSASRSIFKGFVYRHAGTDPNGMDSYSEPLPCTWPELRIGLITVSAKAKRVSSREGMERTVATSPLYKAWPQQVAQDMEKMLKAIKEKDFELLGSTAESNALAMHECMKASTPPLIYFEPETITIINKVQKLRQDGLQLYLTIDAGPNVKLLFLEKDTGTIKNEFPDMRVVNR